MLNFKSIINCLDLYLIKIINYYYKIQTTVAFGILVVKLVSFFQNIKINRKISCSNEVFQNITQIAS